MFCKEEPRSVLYEGGQQCIPRGFFFVVLCMHILRQRAGGAKPNCWRWRKCIGATMKPECLLKKKLFCGRQISDKLFKLFY